MQTIYKYAIEMQDDFTVLMPTGAALLSIQTQGGAPFVWALVDPTRETVTRRFALRGTGHGCEGLEAQAFVGTFQLSGGALVFHLFDLGER